MQGAIDIEIGWDWSFGLGTPLGDVHTEKLNFSFQFQGFFSGKAESVTLLGFACTISPQNLVKIVGAIYEKIDFFHNYVNYVPLILGVGEN